MIVYLLFSLLISVFHYDLWGLMVHVSLVSLHGQEAAV